MLGWIFLVVCLGCVGIGMMSWTRYERSPSCDPFFLGESLKFFLGAALNLAAAALSFFS